MSSMVMGPEKELYTAALMVNNTSEREGGDGDVIRFTFYRTSEWSKASMGLFSW